MPRVLDCRNPDDREWPLGQATRSARNGRLVVAPVEHGYVITTDAFSPHGVRALQLAKNLGPSTVLGVFVGQPQGLSGIASGLTPVVETLMAAFWPGPLSLVVRAQPSLAWSVPSDRFVARMPLHPVALALVREIGPMVHSGVADLGAAAVAKADVVLDVGDLPAGEPSTIVDVTGPSPAVHRVGAITMADLHRVLPEHFPEAPCTS